MRALVTELASDSYTCTQRETILRAQLVMLKAHPTLSACKQYPDFKGLCASLESKGNMSRNVARLALSVVRKLLTGPNGGKYMTAFTESAGHVLLLRSVIGASHPLLSSAPETQREVEVEDLPYQATPRQEEEYTPTPTAATT
ncbi:hypothetical protein KIPB_011006, partial [Kipferlia bialata]|eukprot:g11006.t1